MAVASLGGALKIDPEAEEILQSFNCPGNVRQLENVINRAYILTDGGRSTLADMPPEISHQCVTSKGIEAFGE